jgi:hypothetical protein|tara:strand:- start:380 stop:601 length:222 start_codon:yes stop_codon:yes gene_type:complete
METLENTLRHVHDWAIDRIHKLSEDYATPESDTYESIESLDDAFSIQQEFAEWFNPDISDHDVVSLEYIGDKE